MGNQTTKNLSTCLLLLVWAAIAALPGCTSSTIATAERTITSDEALADFDTMWKIIDQTYYDTDFNGVDWNGVRDELRPQAAAAQNRREIRSIMRDAVGRFGQSHFGIIPEADDEPSASEAETASSDGSQSGQDGIDSQETDSQSDTTLAGDSSTDGDGDWDTGIDIRMIEGQAVVSSIRDQSPAQLAGVQAGWILTKVRSYEIAERLTRLAQAVSEIEFDIYGSQTILNSYLQGPPDTTIDLTFIDGQGEAIELNVARAPMPGEFIKFGNLPPMSTHLEWSRMTMTSESGRQTEIGVISFNVWMMPIISQFEKAIYELRDVDGLIIDLRGNTGGIAGLAPAAGRFLLSERGSLGTMSMRGTDLSFNIEPVIVTTWGEPIDPFAGPIAVLTDSVTASTSEFFAGGLQSLERAQVFGTRSAGMALPAGMDKLPSGDVLLHAIANYTTSTGQELEHDGVVPDHKVPLTREDLLKGIDLPKQVAAEWIEKTIVE